MVTSPYVSDTTDAAPKPSRTTAAMLTPKPSDGTWLSVAIYAVLVLDVGAVAESSRTEDRGRGAAGEREPSGRIRLVA